MTWKILVAAVLAAALLTAGQRDVTGPAFEAALARAAAEEAAARPESSCPLSAAARARAETWLLEACADGGTDWIRAADLYGADAESVFRVYGADPAFREVFLAYGHPVVPVVAYFVRNGSTTWRLSRSVGDGLSRLWNEGRVDFSATEISPEQFGLIAVHQVAARGHELLAEFEIVEGVAVRKPVTRVLLGAKQAVFGGVTDLEAVLARGERLPTFAEVGWAALDATIVVGGAGAAVGALRATARPLAVAGRQGTAVVRLQAAGGGAVRALAGVGRVAGVGAAVAVPYVAVTRPHLVTAAAGWVAEQAGLPALVGVFLAWTLLLGIVAFVLRPAIIVVSLLVRFAIAPLVRLLIRLAGTGGEAGRRTRRARAPLPG